MIELLGWGSSLILLATLIRQVYTRWRSGATAGVSKRLSSFAIGARPRAIQAAHLMHGARPARNEVRLVR
jgi:hypothetical protein